MDYGDGRRHGGAGARPARLRVRAHATACRCGSWCSPTGDARSTRRRMDGGVRRGRARWSSPGSSTGSRARRRRAHHGGARGARRRAGARCTYRLRDWGVSRQRYWGAPIPVVYCERCGIVPVPEADLPVVLPDDVEFTGARRLAARRRMRAFVRTHVSALRRAGAARDRHHRHVRRVVVVLPALHARRARRRAPFDPDASSTTGSAARGPVHRRHRARRPAPAVRALLHQGAARPRRIPSDASTSRSPNLLTQGMVIKDGAKMSKSKGNVVDPDYLIERYGADTARLFSLFAAPPERDLDWSDQGVEGHEPLPAPAVASRARACAPRLARRRARRCRLRRRRRRATLHRLTHQTIARVTEDVGRAPALQHRRSRP